MSTFQNAIDFNKYQMDQAASAESSNEGIVSKYRLLKYKHLVQYVKWLGLELPRQILTNDIGKENPEKLGNLRVSLQDVAREQRMNLIRERAIDRSLPPKNSGISDCEKLLKDLRKSANNAEKQMIDIFLL